MPELENNLDSKDSIIELFGSNVFNTTVMRKRLPKHIYEAMMKAIKEDEPLTREVAEVVANAMKDWALEQGATHFTHWFQPLTGITAEKHDAFINPTEEGKVIMEFSGKELVKGEPDASSFPSGGLRATFEARGYTAWDPSSYAFVKGTTLYIPTTFISYTGEVLDQKTPLLRSMKAVSDEAVKTLSFFGNNVKKVTTTVGAEQEYFLVERDAYKKRKDLILTGRTLFGAEAPKGQELDDHYFGKIRNRVIKYMEKLDKELWKLGIPSKTRHNEVAPAQHELAPVFSTSNQAVDNNQLVMELMKKVAAQEDLYCLLHEKPFEGINGSGKHNNWAISTDTGENLLNPGEDPLANLQFMTFLTAVIEAVDRYPELMRISVASAGNDHRLGANEAPPAIVSMFLGAQLDQAVKGLIAGKTKLKDVEKEEIDVGVDIVPNFKRDVTDRNRTSPFAFTGNKFEFRMLGSNQSISHPNIVLNTIVAEILSEYNEELEKFDEETFDENLREFLRDRLIAHRKVIFNGDNYAPEWVEEAERRGLPNLKTTPDALKELFIPKNIDVFEKHHILSPTELKSRQDVYYDDYSKLINIEAQTMIEMAYHEILPASLDYIRDLTETLKNISEISIPVNTEAEQELLKEASDLAAEVSEKITNLEKINEEAKAKKPGYEQAKFYQEKVIEAMKELREPADKLEQIVGSEYWPYPIYEDLLFYV